MCLGMSSNIHHLIDSVEYPFEVWNNLDKYFGMQEVEDEAWSEQNISSRALSLNISWPLHSLMNLFMMKNFFI